MQEPEQIESKENKPVTVKSSKRNGGVLFLATLALIIAATSLIFQFFFWQLHKQTQAKLISESSQLQNVTNISMQRVRGELQAQQKTLQDFIRQTSIAGSKRSLYQLEEAKHLLVMSQYSLMYDHNIDLAIKMLTDADQKLQQTNDPSINPIRADISNAIVALNALPKIDTAGIIMNISAISDQISSLSTLPVMNTEAKPIVQKNKAAASWTDKLMAAVESMRDVVSIRRLPETIKPLPSSQQQVYLVENIRLQLAQAEWAVLHQDVALYVLSLENAKKELSKYYSANPTAANLIKMLTELQQLNIKPKVPDLSNTINSLQSYIENATQNLNTQAKPTEQLQPNSQLPTTPNTGVPTTNNTPPIPAPVTNNPIPRALPS